MGDRVWNAYGFYNEKNDWKDCLTFRYPAASGEPTEASKMLIQLLGKAGQLRAGSPTWAWRHLKHPAGRDNALRFAYPVGADSTAKKKPGTELLLRFVLPQLVSSGLSTAETRSRSLVPFSACSRVTVTQHFKCLYFGFRRLEMQAGEDNKNPCEDLFENRTKLKAAMSQSILSEHFLPCKESYKTCTC